MRFKIKYHTCIFEKYRIFNIDEHIHLSAQYKTAKYFLKIKGPQHQYCNVAFVFVSTLTSLHQYMKWTTISILLICRGRLLGMGRSLNHLRYILVTKWSKKLNFSS